MPAAKLPGYPKDPHGAVLESDFEGRQLIEITHDKFNVKIGGFGAYDFFGDGSFYLLDVPGHTVGHMSGLARTSSSSSGKDTFILMGADTCHHGGEFRPSVYLPLPDSIVPNPYSSLSTPCPGHIFEHLHPNPEHYRTEPFYRIRVNEDGTSVAEDAAAATQSITHLQEFDAAENVLVVIAHDASLLDVVDVYPKKANEWKEKGWKEKGRWRFLSSWDVEGERAGKE
jgi:glyoxylase-like metal-dependent hydrolase (beta-lactamase superfamily II)